MDESESVTERLRRAGRRLGVLQTKVRAHGMKVGLLLIGFVLGGLTFAGRSCFSPAPHHGQPTSPSSAPEATVWTCSMHPQVRQSEPGKCPICGMDLIPVSSGAEEGSVDTGRLVLSKRAQTLAKLNSAPVRRRAASATLRLLARIEPNEAALKTVTAWIGGRIDQLHVNVTGQQVRAGQVIATLYSPEVFAAHQDLLVAKQQVEHVGQGPESSRRVAAAALDATRQRLRLLGVPDAVLAQMEKATRPTRALAIRTPFAGTVIERLANQGAYVSTGTPLYRIANLETVWAQLEAYEGDLPQLSLGQPVHIEVEALPGKRFEGQVAFIDPTVDLQRRTAQVRVELDNREGQLRPGMFGAATVTTAAASGHNVPLVVPASAPLFTGRRAVIYVEIEEGAHTTYEPRTVRLGPRLGDVYPVIAGLSEGERIVTRGAFALDADLQLRGGPSMMSAADDRETDTSEGQRPRGSAAPAGGHRH